MTRWARAGNSQKHRKMPEDPTPWEELVSQRKAVAKPQKKFVGNKINKISNEVAQTSLKKKLQQRLKKVKLQGKQHDSSLLIENDSNDLSAMLQSDPPQSGHESHSDGDDNLAEHRKSEMCSKKNRRKKMFEFLSKGDDKVKNLPKIKKLKTSKKKSSAPSDSGNMDINQTNLLVPHKNKKHKTVKKECTEPLLSDEVFENEEEKKLLTDSGSEEDRKAGYEEENETSSFDFSREATESSKSTPRNSKHVKRKSFLESVKESRERSGIPRLPQDVESRLYRMKRSLRAKHIPGEQIKMLVRAARRKAELNYRKTQKTCFNCREFGHVLANCPKIAEDMEQGTGICFKCGSTEHKSFRCHIKTSEFPYAKCFVCHNTGHLSRDCPENKHGVYPKGGNCNLCGSIYHLRKDCPKSSRKKDQEVEVTAHTINEFGSIDDEAEEMESKPVKQKKSKVVKF